MSVLYHNIVLEEDTDEDKIYYRVLWIDSKQEIMYIFILNDSNALPIKVNVLDIITDIQNDMIRVSLSDPYYKLYMEEELNASQRERIEKNWHLIQRLLSKENIPAIFESKARGEILKAYIQQGYTKPTLYKLLRMYWKNGQNKGAIVDNYKNCGGKGKEKILGQKKVGRQKKDKNIHGEGTNVTQQVKKLIVNAFQKYYMNQKENSLRYTYERFLAENFMDKLNLGGETALKFKKDAKPPSYAQFVYWAKKLTSSHKVSIKRLGEKEHNLTQRAILGKSNDYVYGPGSLYQIDSTIADVYVVSSNNYNAIIGRPTLYLVVDVFSRMIVGFHVDTRAASLEMARLALYCAVSDKEEYCENFGVSIETGEWIASNLPAALLADRGELIGKEAQKLADRINIRLENTPPYRADLKGIVERALGILQQNAKPLLPGYVEKNFGKRGAPDYRLKAVLTIQDIRKIIIEYIRMYNQKILEHYELSEEMLRDQVVPTPNNIWNWGVEKCSGILRTFPKEELKFAFMSIDVGRVSAEGIKYKNMRYTCAKAIQEHWFEKARNKGWKIRVLFDPRNMTFIYIKDESKESYIACEMDKTSVYYGKSLSEIEYLQKTERELKKFKAKESLERKLTYQSRVEEVVVDAEQRTESIIPIFVESNTSKIKNIRERRTEDNFERQPQEAFLIENKEEDEKLHKRTLSLGHEQEEAELNEYELEQLKLYEKLMEEEGNYGKKMVNHIYKEENHFHPKAVYLPQQVKEYEGNPFLETLPPILSTESLYNSLAVYPHFNKEERLHSKELRSHYVMRLNSFFQPYGRQISLYNLFDRALRQGYLCRNPMDREEKLLLREIYDNLQKGKVPVINNDGVPGEGFMIIGTSGVGKSRSLSRLLSTYPQVIQHTEYKDRPFIRKQVLYLKIDCPHDGTLKGLIGAFFKKLDSLLGTEYTEQIYKSRATVSRLIVAMQTHIVQHGIGVLIVDEIQHLSIAKNQGEEVMLNFFVTLNNICKIPIIFIGTPKTEVLYKKALRQIRRMCGQGDLVWMHHRETDREWELLLRGLWRYQWNREYTELTPELSKVMFEYSQGIIAIAVKLFMLVQMETMKKKKEIITPTIIKRVSENYLKSLQPVLKAMKTGKKSNMTRYEDIVLSTLDNTLDSGLNEITNVVNVDYFLEQQEKLCNESSTKDIDIKIIQKLQIMGVDYEVAKVAVEKIIEEYGEKKSFKFLLQRSASLALIDGLEEDIQNEINKK